MVKKLTAKWRYPLILVAFVLAFLGYSLFIHQKEEKRQVALLQEVTTMEKSLANTGSIGRPIQELTVAGGFLSTTCQKDHLLQLENSLKKTNRKMASLPLSANQSKNLSKKIANYQAEIAQMSKKLLIQRGVESLFVAEDTPVISGKNTKFLGAKNEFITKQSLEKLRQLLANLPADDWRKTMERGILAVEGQVVISETVSQLLKTIEGRQNTANPNISPKVLAELETLIPQIKNSAEEKKQMSALKTLVARQGVAGK